MWDKKLKNRTIKKKLSRWMTVVCSFLLAVGLGFSVGSAAAEYFPESRETQAQTKAVQTKKVSVGGMPAATPSKIRHPTATHNALIRSR